MRKFLWTLLIILIVLTVTGLVVWNRRASIASQFLRSSLRAPVKMESIEFSPRTMTIANLWIGNPSSFLTPTAFKSGFIDVTSSISQLFGQTLIIDSVEMNDLFVGIEYKGSKTNWDRMLSSSHGNRSSFFKRKHYLIKRLVLRNLTIEVIKKNGQLKSYPTLDTMEFYNISDETGFPIHEIEKAIFNLMMQGLFEKFDLQKLLPPLFQQDKESLWPSLIPKFFQK